ncbi:MAG TPA: tRNA (adenosine(37)-N6)-dimethylallyltransferase MiaA [Thermomicrobiales bacterium]|nr:tRNA (adenosine(37)-N6)-dimethylallyltransferase MiaA [Thermomicrobiales bacterium]
MAGANAIDTSTPNPPLIVLTGPTATGKTAAAIRLAAELPVEIINGDSRLFYRGMDIGTAKPTREERTVVPHHLIDTLDPTETMTVARFQDEVYALIEEIHDHHRLPVLVGGTQQYINAVIEGWRIPRVPPEPALRARLQQEADEHGRDYLLARLRALDPDAAAPIGSNLRRIIRALEVIEVTGRPVSEQQGKTEVPFAPLLIGLTMPRDLLYERIDRRVEEMLDAGLIDEVRALLHAGVPEDAPALSSIGYRQVLPHLHAEAAVEEVAEHIRNDTHRLVRHQQTWLRKSAGLVEIDVSSEGWFERLRDHIARHIARHRVP